VQSITSTEIPAHARTQTFVGDAKSQGSQTKFLSVEQQELAGRLLLTRRQLMERVASSLRPLFGAQILQVLIGVALIALGAQCWARNMDVPHRVVCGGILHVYGILVISQAALVFTKLKRIDYSKPVDEIRTRLDGVRAAYLRAGVIVGFVWWLMWIPVAVAVGFDAVLHPKSLVVSLIVGVIGLLVSVWLYWGVLTSQTDSAETWKMKFSSESIKAAYCALDEIESAQIR
jgi:serine/threonine-protein kinase